MRLLRLIAANQRSMLLLSPEYLAAKRRRMRKKESLIQTFGIRQGKLSDLQPGRSEINEQTVLHS